MEYFGMNQFGYSMPYYGNPYTSPFSFNPRWQDIGRPNGYRDQFGPDNGFGTGEMFDFSGQRQQDYYYNPIGRNPSSMSNGQANNVYDLFASPRPAIRSNPRGSDLGSVFFEFKS